MKPCQEYFGKEEFQNQRWTPEIILEGSEWSTLFVARLEAPVGLDHLQAAAMILETFQRTQRARPPATGTIDLRQSF